MPGTALAAGHAHRVARPAWQGLIQVLAGSDPAPARWRSPWHRRAVHGGLGVATLVLCAASLASVSGVFVRFGPVQWAHGPGKIIPRTATHAAQKIASFGAVSRGPNVVLPGWLMPGGALILGVLVALVVVAPLPLAARYPLLGWRIGWLALLLVPLAGVPWLGGRPWDPVQILALVVVFCVAGVRHQRPVLWWMWALTLIPWWLWARHDRPGLFAAALGTVAFTAAAIAVDSMSSRRRAQQALADQAERTDLEQARRAVLEERARIARELHDVVAHHMSLIAVRAETAPYRLSGLPEPVRAEFGALSEAAREALTDMRRLLGVLRHDSPAMRAPQPQLSDLPGLIEDARHAGVPVELSVPPALGQVPSGVGVCAYRIVQESLSNASRHAPGAAVTVSVAHDARAVLLRVANGPSGLPGPSGNGHGPGPRHGLTGMRERVALLGGSLSAGPSPDGGFIVSAVLPLSAAA
jgi:signal transduction histidine kinase